ncbi:MAG: prenyltransferase [Firmicutes bacterium]|nr:prenyltransferase [Bacillota bacterium]
MQKSTYGELTVKHALGLASPHTWAASVFPVLLGSALAKILSDSFSWLIFLLLLPATILLQSSVNTLNDYYDFIKGNDKLENSEDPADAILVYNKIDPRLAQKLGFGFMGAAALLGLYPIFKGGIVTLIIGLGGCTMIWAYSAGPKPISYLPLGEIVSGTVMGALITAAVFASHSGYVRGIVFFLSLPLVFSIALIMMTNNICDIERDTPIGRLTLPVLLGRPHACIVYRICVLIWLLMNIICIAVYFHGILIPVSIMLLAIFPLWRRLLCQPLIPQQRGLAMKTIILTNLAANTIYVSGIVLQYIITT